MPNHIKGTVINTFNWPLYKEKSRGFLYTSEDFLHIGLIAGLDYTNPHINLYKEFQNFKTHPFIKKFLTNGECVEFGAKILDDGGFFSVPKLSFPGGMIVGSGGGLTNPMTNQGVHTAMKSGILAAEALYEKNQHSNIEKMSIDDYYDKYRKSWIFKELFQYRHMREAFNRSPFYGLFYSGFTRNLHKEKSIYFIENYKKGDNLSARELTGFSIAHKLIKYPEPDNIIAFDQGLSLERSKNIFKNQPEYIYLKKNARNDVIYSFEAYGGIEEKLCPTGVFTYKDSYLYINSTKCIQCGSCKLKSTRDMIVWNPPEAGTGPQ